MLPPAHLTTPLLSTPARINPFSLRQDLNGGRCKLLDTPSKSVISLTFTLPALRDPCASPHLIRGTPGLRAPQRRCQSLPCTPELSRTVALPGDMEEEKDQDKMGERVGDDKSSRAGVTEEVEKRLYMEITEKRLLAEEEERRGDDSGLPIELEMVTLERLEEEEENICVTEAMDCTKSPDPAEGGPDSMPERPLLTSLSSLRSNGWRLAISNGPPSLPRLDNNNGSPLVIGQQIQWGGGGRANGYSGAQVVSSDPSGPSEQDDVISCTSCCLMGLSFPSMCLRGSAAVAAPHRRASLPRQRPYRNLNSTITSGSAASSAPATASKTLLCRSANGLVAGTSASCEPGLALPEAQT